MENWIFYLWNQIRQHRAALYSHDLFQAVQGKLGCLFVILTIEIQSIKGQDYNISVQLNLSSLFCGLTSCLSRLGRMSSRAW